MQANTINKVYLARVRGNFSKVVGDDDTVTVKNHIYCESNIEARMACKPLNEVPFEFKGKAKESETMFKFKFYDEANDMSIVKAYPKTGRTHQIRVHLMSLGHPIAND